MPNKALTAALAVCLFLLIVGAKWTTFDRFGSPMPDWDQWDAEGSELFIPWFAHDHFIQHLFTPHNEHRVILTKLQNLTLGLLNGQWDSRVEAVTNALLHAALGVAFWLYGSRCVIPGSSTTQASAPEPYQGQARMPALLSTSLFFVTAALFGLQLAWENVLGGFHSQQYWLLALSFGAMISLPIAPAWSAAWWGGAVCALLALGSMGSGFLAAAVIAVVIGVRLFRRATTFRETVPTLAFVTLVTVIGIVTRVEFPGHQKLKPTTLHDFFFSIIHSLEWPLRDASWAALVMWLPWAWVACVVLSRTTGAASSMPVDSERRSESAARNRTVARSSSHEAHAGWIIVTLGGWVLTQILATAYARGAGANYPASRYVDTLVFGAMTNAVALAWLLSRDTKDSTAKRSVAVVGLLWLAVSGIGAFKSVSRAWGVELPHAKNYYINAEAHLRRYLATHNINELAFPDIPYPSAEGLVQRLEVPALRALMPAPIRPPIPLSPAAPAFTDREASFLENEIPPLRAESPPRRGLSVATPALDATRTWGSFAQGGLAAIGEWRSAPVASTTFAWLKFETAGHVGEEGVALELRDARTDAPLARVQPSKVPGDSWRAAYVRMPRASFVVVARDADPKRWLAFSSPVEMGALSYWAWQATKHGWLVLYVGAIGSAILWTACWRASGANRLR